MDPKVEYWLDIAEEDVITAKVLLEKGRLLHCGFFCHLVAEKALKAAVASTGIVPPKIHDLLRLATIGGVIDELTDEDRALLHELNPLNIEARYPGYKNNVAAALSAKRCSELINGAEMLLCWTKTRLCV